RGFPYRRRLRFLRRFLRRFLLRGLLPLGLGTFRQDTLRLGLLRLSLVRLGSWLLHFCRWLLHFCRWLFRWLVLAPRAIPRSPVRRLRRFVPPPPEGPREPWLRGVSREI